MVNGFASRAQAALDAAEVPGVVAMARDRDGLVFEGAAGVRRLGEAQPMTLDTVVALFSCTKALTATAALRLVEDGALDLDRPARAYLPAIGEIGVLEGYEADGAPRIRPPRRAITARMLMLHTAGFAYDFANPLIKRGLEAGLLTPHRTATQAGFRHSLVRDPGEAWEYGLNIDWLGMVIEAVAGQRLDALLRAQVLDPLGMHETGHILTPAMRARLASMHQREDDGAIRALELSPRETMEVFPGGGGMFGTVGDYIKFLGVWLNEGAGVLRPETIAWASRGGVAVTPLPSVAPRVSGVIDFLPGQRKSWAYSFLVNDEAAPTGRSAGSLAWGGLGNLYYWIDVKRGVAGFWAAQMFPFVDPAALGAAQAFETAIYEGLR